MRSPIHVGRFATAVIVMAESKMHRPTNEALVALVLTVGAGCRLRNEPGGAVAAAQHPCSPSTARHGALSPLDPWGCQYCPERPAMVDLHVLKRISPLSTTGQLVVDAPRRRAPGIKATPHVGSTESRGAAFCAAGDHTPT